MSADLQRMRELLDDLMAAQGLLMAAWPKPDGVSFETAFEMGRAVASISRAREMLDRDISRAAVGGSEP